MRSSEIYPAPPTVADQELWEEKEVSTEQSSLEVGENKDLALQQTQDAFGNEEFAEVKYKVLKWWYASHCTTYLNIVPDVYLGNAACSWWLKQSPWGCCPCLLPLPAWV